MELGIILVLTLLIPVTLLRASEVKKLEKIKQAKEELDRSKLQIGIDNIFLRKD